MSVLVQIFVILIICLAAEGISALLPFAMPAAVLAMVLLLILLFTKCLKPHQLKQEADFFLDHMPLFFIPACVSVLKYTDVLFSNFWAIVLISLLTTPLVFFVAGHAVQLTMKLMKKKEEQV